MHLQRARHVPDHGGSPRAMVGASATWTSRRLIRMRRRDVDARRARNPAPGGEQHGL